MIVLRPIRNDYINSGGNVSPSISEDYCRGNSYFQNWQSAFYADRLLAQGHRFLISLPRIKYRAVKRNNGIRITDILWGRITTSFGIIDLSNGISRFFQRNNELFFTGIME